MNYFNNADRRFFDLTGVLWINMLSLAKVLLLKAIVLTV